MWCPGARDQRERVTPEGEQDVVAPAGIVQRGEVQRDQDERTDVLHAGGLDVDVVNDSSLVVVVQWSNVIGRGWGAA
jgi:hypothetical protein